ncbi:MAG: type II secretion system protein M [Candidatus Binatia bacterium]|nr:type II secretion system protein M [Candidatus Binatia bacterium]
MRKFLFRLEPRSWLAHLPRPPRLSLPASQAYATLLTRLSPRERRLLGAAGMMACGVAAYLLVIDPVWEWHARLRARVAAKERELEEILALRRTYLALRQEVQRTRMLNQMQTSPFAFLEELATSTVGREKVAALTPTGRETHNGVSQETLELRLQGVSLREVVELLHKIESAGIALRTVQLSIKKSYKDPYAFDVALTHTAFTPQ